ncbi:MAG TPA: hypothetical protein VD973_17700 [Symbiobacteriaceae bacterium]|nr:hypothetical protein [Symbiobacteriaceae bacterium]
MAKLDFFVRYPDFFEVARTANTPSTSQSQTDSNVAVESAMVRHHYGPWDKRYYHVLAHLEAKGLITVAKERTTYRITLTGLGRERANKLAIRPSFGPLVERMREVKKAFGGKSGNYLKQMIYRVFENEVGRRPMGEVIRP